MTLEEFIKDTDLTQEQRAGIAKTALENGYFDKAVETAILKSELQIYKNENEQLADDLKRLSETNEKLKKHIEDLGENESLIEFETLEEIQLQWEDAQKTGITMCGQDFGRFLVRKGFRMFK